MLGIVWNFVPKWRNLKKSAKFQSYGGDPEGRRRRKTGFCNSVIKNLLPKTTHGKIYL